uniref:Uncharacterized protein n=1 Tax=viral metagenome TaxID=1070528 RepID=A0A6C0HDT3_9ZZZZ
MDIYILTTFHKLRENRVPNKFSGFSNPQFYFYLIILKKIDLKPK